MDGNFTRETPMAQQVLANTPPAVWDHTQVPIRYSEEQPNRLYQRIGLALLTCLGFGGAAWAWLSGLDLQNRYLTMGCSGTVGLGALVGMCLLPRTGENIFSFNDENQALGAQHYRQLVAERTYPYLLVYIRNQYHITMDGLAWIANQQAEKNGAENLLVCQSLTAFERRLKFLASQPSDWRGVLIVPTYSHGQCQLDCQGTGFEHRYSHEQHKVPIFVEKQGDALRIAVWDCGGDTTSRGGAGHFEVGDTIVHTLKKAAVPATYYRCATRTNYGIGGCETFSMKHSIAFLRDAKFFAKLDQHGVPQPAAGTIDQPHLVTNPPPEMMKPLQSATVMEAYRRYNAKRFDLNGPLIGHQDGRTLAQHWQRHQFSLRDTTKLRVSDRNKQIDRRVLKYQHQLVAAMAKDPAAVCTALKKNLIVAA